MPTYAGSHLEASGPITSSAKRNIRRILEKQVRTTPSEKLMMEVEISIPHDVTDIKGNKQRIAEIVAKLKNKLKEGPLKDGKTDEEWLDGAIEFLVTDKGKAWTRSWFQPQAVATGSAFTSNTTTWGKASSVVAGKVKTKPNVHPHGNAQLEHQGGQSHDAGVMPLLSSPMEDSSAIASATTPPRSMISGSAPLGIGSSHRPISAPSPSPSFVEMALLMATKLTSSAKEVASVPSQLLPGIGQHQRSHSDPGQVSLCLQCRTVHGISYGGPFPTVSTEAALTTRGMQIRRNVRNETWPVYIMRRVFTPLNMMALFIVFLVPLSRGYPKNSL